jgi:hypothetical protein
LSEINRSRRSAARRRRVAARLTCLTLLLAALTLLPMPSSGTSLRSRISTTCGAVPANLVVATSSINTPSTTTTAAPNRPAVSPTSPSFIASAESLLSKMTPALIGWILGAITTISFARRQRYRLRRELDLAVYMEVTANNRHLQEFIDNRDNQPDRLSTPNLRIVAWQAVISNSYAMDASTVSKVIEYYGVIVDLRAMVERQWGVLLNGGEELEQTIAVMQRYFLEQARVAIEISTVINGHLRLRKGWRWPWSR